MRLTHHVINPPRTTPQHPQLLLRPTNKGRYETARFVKGDAMVNFQGLGGGDVDFEGPVGRIVGPSFEGARIRRELSGQALCRGLGALSGYSEVCGTLRDISSTAGDALSAYAGTRTSKTASRDWGTAGFWTTAGSGVVGSTCPPDNSTSGSTSALTASGDVETEFLRQQAAAMERRVREAEAAAAAADARSRAAAAAKSGGVDTKTVVAIGAVAIVGLVAIKFLL